MNLHSLSIPYRGLSRGLSLGSGAFFLVLFGGEMLPFPGWVAALPLAAAGFLAGFAWEVAYYRRFEYELTADTLVIASGVLSRRDRDVPLARVQNVDISRNVLQRALGIAVVEFETAGGGSTEAVLRYVGYEEAKRLQQEVRRRKEGIGDEGEKEEGAEPLVEPPGETLFEIGDGELAILSVASFDPGFVLTALFLAGSVVGTGFGLFADPLRALTTGVGLFVGIALVAVAWMVGAIRTVSRYYGFRLIRQGEELQYERGLLQRYDGSIPLAKVQTVGIRENPLMRRLGYATLVVETAGYAPGSAPGGGSEAAVPLARRDRVLALARSIEPFDDLDFERPPKRARTRYAVRYVLALGVLTALLGVAWWYFGFPDRWYFPLVLAPLAPVAAHYKWASRGYHVGDEHVATRNGFWRRTITVVPYYRTQTVIESATVFQRRWKIATLVVDTAGSRSLLGEDAAAVDVDRGTAAELREVVVRRLRASRLRRRRGRMDREFLDSGDEMS